MSSFDSTFEKYLLKWAAEAFAAKNPENWSKFWKPIYTELENGPTRQIFDNPWDMKAIEWAYDTFDVSQAFDSSEKLLPFQAFNIYCNFFKIKTKN